MQTSHAEKVEQRSQTVSRRIKKLAVALGIGSVSIAGFGSGSAPQDMPAKAEAQATQLEPAAQDILNLLDNGLQEKLERYDIEQSRDRMIAYVHSLQPDAEIKLSGRKISGEALDAITSKDTAYQESLDKSGKYASVLENVTVARDALSDPEYKDYVKAAENLTIAAEKLMASGVDIAGSYGLQKEDVHLLLKAANQALQLSESKTQLVNR